MATMQVQLVSPEKILFSGEATQVITRTLGGGERSEEHTSELQSH